MTEETLEFEDSYNISLDNFSGPLDLLLHLIKEAKMDIMEIKLASITEQYLQYMTQLDDLDMEKASDFIIVAATLIEIKSKSLLPRDPVMNPDEVDEETRLKQQILEYQIFKEASQKLQSIEEIDRLYKAPDKDAEKCRIVLKDMVLDKLLDAFVGILTKIEQKEKSEEPKKIVRDRFTVAEKIVQIRQSIIEKKQMNFTELFDEDSTKSEVINVFLALLELLKMQVIKAMQGKNFGEITILSNIKDNENGKND